MDDNIESPLGFWGSSAEEMLVSRFPIHRACRDGDPVALSRLIAEAPPEQLLLEDQFYSWTPIHWAAYFGKNDCLLGLLQCGVDVNIRTTQFQQAPIHIASFGGHPDTLLQLLKMGADFDARDFLGESALHKAARVGNADCIRTLLTHGTPVSAYNSNDLTACDLAQQQGFHECVHVLKLAQTRLSENSSFQGNRSRYENGSSGSITNGHQNGLNGHGRKFSNRKRPCDDISMPFIKRSRTSGAAEDPISRAQYSQNGCFNLVANSSPSNQDCSMTVPDSIVKRKQSFMTSAEKYVSELQGFGINDGVIEQDHAKCYPFHSMQPNRMGHYF